MENRLFSLYNDLQRGNPMQVSLYPYNYWCLIAAFVLLLALWLRAARKEDAA